MPSPAPGAERLAGGVAEDPVPAASARPGARRAWWWAGAAVFGLVIVVLFDAYLHLSKTYPENSDEANILLMATDMLHGNVYLSGWNVSDVPFITTELPEITLLVWMFGLHLNTAHIAAAVTYTLVDAVAMLLAKGRAKGPKGIARMAVALAILLVPQPGFGVFVIVFSVGHIGTALPVMLTWLVLDRFGLRAPDGTPYTVRQRWWVPVIVAVMIGWALMADPLVLIIAVYPLLVVCLARVVTGLTTGGRNGPGLRGIGRALADRWLELALAAAAGFGYLVVWLGRELLTNAGGYKQQAVPFYLDGGRWFMQARVAVHGLLEMFGAYFVPGNAINYYKSGTYLSFPPLSGLDQALAITRVICVLLALWGACAIAWRFFRRDADWISQLLLTGIVLNLAAYIPSHLADYSAFNVREIAPVLPLSAVLAARMLGERLIELGPAVRVRLPRARRALTLRLIVIPLVALFGWYSFGLFQQADAPAAPNPFAALETYLEAHNLTYGIGGYWNASVITVDTGGRVTVVAVQPACLQPYPWENKPTWYDAKLHAANFLLIDNVPGYFSQFGVSGISLSVLNDVYPADERTSLGTGGYVAHNPAGKAPTVTWNFAVHVYDGNLLGLLGRHNLLYQTLDGKPADANAPVGPANPAVDC
jgi:hypothetical protein